MKIKGKPQEIANQILDKLDTYKPEQEIIGDWELLTECNQHISR